MKVGHDDNAEKNFRKELQAKQNAYRTAKGYAEQFVKVDDTLFMQSFVEGFKTAFINKYRSEFPPIVSEEMMFTLSEVDLNKLSTLWSEFNKLKIELDPETLEPKQKQDFGIYLTTDSQIKLYKKLKTICDSINEYRTESSLHQANIISGFNGALIYDWNTATIAPNVSYVQLATR